MTKPARLVAFGGFILAGLVFVTARGEAHKPITSKYTYNDDVFPIFRDKCSRCHVPGGVAPMSLMTYEEAFPWAESMRAELVAAHMPPANPEEGFGAVTRGHSLSPHELDVILTWATGGNPRGALDQMLPAVTLKNEWVLGAPDLTLQLPSEYTLSADKLEATEEFTLTPGAPGANETRWIRAVDLLPGTPAIVRSAVIYVKTQGESTSNSQVASTSTGTSTGPDRVLARWLPGQDPAPARDGAAFKLPPGARLGLRIHYKKTWQYEGKQLTDRSTVGLYFAAERTQELLAIPLTSATESKGSLSERQTFTHTLDEDVRALAINPDQVPPNVVLQVEAVLPGGARTPLIRLSTRPDWARRYWFDPSPVLPRGTRIEVVTTPEDPDLFAAILGPPPAQPAARPTPLRLALDVIPVKAAGAQ
jgi:hypothetical protein